MRLFNPRDVCHTSPAMGHPHPEIGSWNRHEDGSYTRDYEGWSLTVHWVSGGHDTRGHFNWTMVQGGENLQSDHGLVELEAAMAESEQMVRVKERLKTARLASKAEAAIDEGA